LLVVIVGVCIIGGLILREFFAEKIGKQKLSVEFDPSIPGCVSPGVNMLQFRMKVANHTGNTRDGCRGFIVQIDGPGGFKFVERIPLTWALLVHIVERKLHDGDEMFLNLVEVISGRPPRVITDSNWRNHVLFPEPGNYKITATVSSEQTSAQTLQFDFEWFGNESAKLSRVA
jgi:hypothetical protein